MLIKNLSQLPTAETLYNQLSAIPCFTQPVNMSGTNDFCGYSTSAHFSGSDALPNGLMTFLNGNFIISAVKASPIEDGNSFLWTTFQGDNLFAIKTEMEVDGDYVIITTHLCNGTANEMTRNLKNDLSDSNSTTVRQSFLKMGSNNEARQVNCEILSTGFNQLGEAIPTFADVNEFTALLERLYSTSDFVKKANFSLSYANISDFENFGAFWESWGDAIKAGATVAGGVVGGVAGGVAGGPVGALGGAAAGASLGNFASGALIPNSLY